MKNINDKCREECHLERHAKTWKIYDKLFSACYDMKMIYALNYVALSDMQRQETNMQHENSQWNYEMKYVT